MPVPAAPCSDSRVTRSAVVEHGPLPGAVVLVGAVPVVGTVVAGTVVDEAVDVDVALRGGDADLLGAELHPAAASPASATAPTVRPLMPASARDSSPLKRRCRWGIPRTHR